MERVKPFFQGRRGDAPSWDTHCQPHPAMGASTLVASQQDWEVVTPHTYNANTQLSSTVQADGIISCKVIYGR